MNAPFAISTADPRFDPRKPVTINGYPFLPAEPEMAVHQPVPGRHRVELVPIKRRRMVSRG